MVRQMFIQTQPLRFGARMNRVSGQQVLRVVEQGAREVTEWGGCDWMNFFRIMPRDKRWSGGEEAHEPALHR